MKKLQDKEQILMAYYAQYFKGASLEDIKQLNQQLSEGIGVERYETAMKRLKEEGLIFGMEEVEARQKEDGVDSPMPTNEGMLYVNNALNLQSEAVEDHQLDYLKNNLKTSNLNFTLETVETYIYKIIEEQAQKKPNRNSP
ncbi:hypothetical protein A1A1_10466 [Planococcus antarcticus DSM 14505]|uniref:Uncharacterized protein n=1 Tax=Planococcus antarcticus DSM 14505 TaxID=1185653 RepID=A0A1C7DBY4_9BACL|nr:hypothetical protein [Planococcus antarcticus]ANU08955.1 hypothetical protein BBH88_00695 [Planococcus antarcticus DSM 14505]EIM06567.1 hypothetical protein A1A1_10466 [Planococcus antarcticus DSM 14505]